jgi:uncharacterized protein (TIGR03382 family)
VNAIAKTCIACVAGLLAAGSAQADAPTSFDALRRQAELGELLSLVRLAPPREGRDFIIGRQGPADRSDRGRGDSRGDRGRGDDAGDDDDADGHRWRGLPDRDDRADWQHPWRDHEGHHGRDHHPWHDPNCVSPVPEPTALSMAMAGLLGLAVVRRRRRG